MTTFLILPVGISFILSSILLILLLKAKFSKNIVDRPNARSLHMIPVPRTGGLAITSGVLGAWGFFSQIWLLPLVLCILLLVALSFLDDVYGLSAGWRFVAHFAVAAIFLIFGIHLGWNNGAWILGLGGIVWATNLYNFMDGSDGLAGGMAAFGFGFYALAAWLAGDMIFAAMNCCVASAALAFLFFNFHPARIFMGDSGSIPLGFLAAALGLIGWMSQVWPLWFPLLVFSPFIVDASTTLAKRLVAGEKIWEAHRSHYYQRLILMGMGHRRTALAEYALMVTAGAAAIYMLGRPDSVLLECLPAWVLVYGGLMFGIDVLWRRYQKRQQSAATSRI